MDWTRFDQEEPPKKTFITVFRRFNEPMRMILWVDEDGRFWDDDREEVDVEGSHEWTELEDPAL